MSFELAFIAQSRKEFAVQFQLLGNVLVFRDKGTGAAVRVTPAERDQFIAAHENHLLKLRRIVLLAPLLVMLPAIILASQFVDSTLLAITIPIIVLFGVIALAQSTKRAMQQPGVALAHRAPLDGSLSAVAAREAAKRRAMDDLRQIPWLRVGGGLVGLGLIFNWQGSTPEFWPGRNTALIVAGCLVLFVRTGFIIRKRLTGAHEDATDGDLKR